MPGRPDVVVDGVIAAQTRNCRVAVVVVVEVIIFGQKDDFRVRGVEIFGDALQRGLSGERTSKDVSAGVDLICVALVQDCSELVGIGGEVENSVSAFVVYTVDELRCRSLFYVARQFLEVANMSRHYGMGQFVGKRAVEQCGSSGRFAVNVVRRDSRVIVHVDVEHQFCRLSVRRDALPIPDTRHRVTLPLTVVKVHADFVDHGGRIEAEVVSLLDKLQPLFHPPLENSGKDGAFVFCELVERPVFN